MTTFLPITITSPQKSNSHACELLLKLRLDDAMMFFCNVPEEDDLKAINLGEAIEE